MLNANNIGFVQYKTGKVTTLDFTTHIACSHTKCPHLMRSQGHSVLVPV